MSTITKTKKKTRVEILSESPFVLTLHNDDNNSFDWVIKCLIEVCNHGFEQASQCAYIVHFNGECDVKYGDFDTLSDMKESLVKADLSVTLGSNQ